jgi:hypothetical protein
VHPYMAQAAAEEHIAELIRVAEANRKARDGAERGSRRWRGPRRRNLAGRQLSYKSAHLVLAHAGPVDSDNRQDRSAELCEAGSAR